MLPAQRRDTEALLRKAAITVVPQRVTASSDAVNALVGEAAAYVKPSPHSEEPRRGQSQGGRSQGANAQRKRANRDGRGQGVGRAGRPSRTDNPRSGRTQQAASAQPVRAAQPQRDRTEQPRTHAPADAPRTRQGSRRAGAAQGKPKLMVGSVVRQNGGNRRAGGR
jgi:hypothetical protein